MYKESDLVKYDYFSNILKSERIEHVIDSLTGLINRKYILDFVRDLINRNIKFTLAMLDLDDFKLVNDKYGHAVGDYVLEHFGNDLLNFVGRKGLVGRYGGDEFIIVLLGINDYDSLHEFYDQMFHSGIVLRKNYKLNNDINIYITGTIGSAFYPKDADSYDDLFLMIDKTLYRGKTKGRNCYIIYVEEKHKDLVIQKMHNDDLPTMMSIISTTFNTNFDPLTKVMDTSNYLKDNLDLDNIFIIDKNNILYDALNLKILSKNADLSNIVFKNERAQIEYRPDVFKLSFGNDIKELGLASLLMTRLKVRNQIYGYLIFALKRNGKVWDTNEISILMYYSKVITLELVLNNE